MPVAVPNFDKPPVKGGSTLHPTVDPVYVPAAPFNENFRAASLETGFEDQPAIISHIEGSPWTLDLYLSQILTGDSPVQGQQMTTHAIHQPYHAIVGMEIRVQGTLSHSQEEASAESTITGSAVVFPFLVPNKGDMMVARMFDGAIGIFQLTRVEKLSVMKDAAHAIDYMLVGRNNKQRYDDLIRKIQKRSYFNRDFLYHGQNPILTEEAFDTLKFLHRTRYQLTMAMFDQFYSVEYATLTIPNQMQPSYDKFMVQAVLSIVEDREHDKVKLTRNLNTQDDPVMKSRSIWDVFRSRDRNQMYDIFTKVGSVGPDTFTYEPIFEGIRYTGIQAIVYPLDPPFHVDTAMGKVNKFPMTGLLKDDPRSPSFLAYKAKKQAYNDSQLEKGQESVPVTDEEVYQELGIKPVFADNYYIFSKEFYENSTEPNAQSKLEVLVNKFIDNPAISYMELRDVATNIHCWSPIERFYFFPVLLVLINSVTRSI